MPLKISEFSREITGAQVHHIAPVLFPELCKILQMSQVVIELIWKETMVASAIFILLLLF